MAVGLNPLTNSSSPSPDSTLKSCPYNSVQQHWYSFPVKRVYSQVFKFRVYMCVAAAAYLITTTTIATNERRHLQRDEKNDKREKGFDLPSSRNQMINVEWVGDGMWRQTIRDFDPWREGKERERKRARAQSWLNPILTPPLVAPQGIHRSLYLFPTLRYRRSEISL